MNHAFDLRAFARRVNQRRREWEILHPEARVPITPALSRILEHDPEYTPYRTRTKKRRSQPLRNPRINTVITIARLLGTTVGDLLDEPTVTLTPAEQDVMKRFLTVAQRMIRDTPRAASEITPSSSR